MATITGTNGADNLAGGNEADAISGQGGNDTLAGSGGDDTVAGNAGADLLEGGDGNDILYAGDVSPIFQHPQYPGGVPALLDTGSETDVLRGGAGDDIFFAGYGDTVDGGPDSGNGDRLLISFLGAPSGISFDFRQATQTIGGGVISGIEYVTWLQGSNSGDYINTTDNIRTDGPDLAVYGAGGNDTIIGGRYTSWLSGDDGDDFIDARESGSRLRGVNGGAGNDTISGGGGVGLSLRGGAGNDVIYARGEAYGDAGDDRIEVLDQQRNGVALYGGSGNDYLTVEAAGSLGDQNALQGGSGADTLIGSARADIIYTGGDGYGGFDLDADHDVVSAGDGDDTVLIGYGDDADGGTGNDNLYYNFNGAPSGITMNLNALLSGQPVTIGGGTVRNFERISVTGTAFADAFTVGNPSGQVTIYGRQGDDIVTSTGNGIYFGGSEGNDRLVVMAGTNSFDGSEGFDTIDYSQYGSAITVNLINYPHGYGTGANDSFSGVEQIIGSAFADSMRGSGDGDVLRGGSGNDTFNGAGGNDTLDGGSGDDVFTVQTANDQVIEAVGGGNDLVTSHTSWTVTPGSEVERVVAAGAAPLDLTGNELANRIEGNDAANLLRGMAGNDALVGAGGSDTLDGGAGDDQLIGGAGNDRFHVDSPGDSLVEDAAGGTDQVVSSISWALGQNLENLILLAGSPSAIAGTGNALDNLLMGNALSNDLNGGAGNDTLDGGTGADTLTGGAGDDSFTVDDPGDQVLEGASGGNDRVTASIGWTLGASQQVETIAAAAGLLVDLTGNELGNSLVGNEQSNLLRGLAGNDVLNGGEGADTLDGGNGADTMIGGGGNDLFLVDNAGDSIFEAEFNGPDRAIASVSWTLTANQQVETVSAAAGLAIDLTGNDLANQLDGNELANTLSGQAGNDTLNGLAGNDFLDGGVGSDRLVGGSGDDTYYADNPNDIAIEEAAGGVDIVFTRGDFSLGANIENLTVVEGSFRVIAGGNALDNLLIGNSAATQLVGQGGNDTLDGGGGGDALFGGDGQDLVRGGADNDGLWGDAGQDILNGGDGHDALFGGDGADILNGDAGNDHLFGQSAAGGADGADTLGGGSGSDYLQGNAGNDLLDGGEGSDRINGGADDDAITGGSANDTVNGNRGNDAIDGGDGNDSLRGGQGNDSVAGGVGDDIISGDLGMDTLSGGSGVDNFIFTGNAGLIDAAGAGFDIITDFQDGLDRLQVGYVVGAVLTGSAQSSVLAARAAAQFSFDRHDGTGEVAVIRVGNDTYLFYSSTNATAADSAIRLAGIDPSAISLADFG